MPLWHSPLWQRRARGDFKPYPANLENLFQNRIGLFENKAIVKAQYQQAAFFQKSVTHFVPRNMFGFIMLAAVGLNYNFRCRGIKATIYGPIGFWR